MVTGAASQHYKNFIEIVCAYLDMFEGMVSINEILQTPYPIFQDVIEKQLQRKKKQREIIEKQQGLMKGTNLKAGDLG